MHRHRPVSYFKAQFIFKTNALSVTVNCNSAICRDIIIYRKAGFMNLIKISDIRITMSMLLLKDAFDAFLLEEAEVLTYAKLVLNGRRNKNWYIGETEIEEPENNGIIDETGNYTELIRWKEVKNVFFEYIKGKKTPDLFKVSLKADSKIANIFLKDSGFYGKYLQEKPELHMQLRYENGTLCVVTGIYNNNFTLDKSVENAWDIAVQKWFQANNVSFEIM